MTTNTTRRALLKGAPAFAAGVAAIGITPAALASTARTDREGWERAKAEYEATVQGIALASRSLNDADAAMIRDSRTAPMAAVSYGPDGFTIGAITTGLTGDGMKLCRDNFNRVSEYNGGMADLKDTTGFQEYGRALKAWEDQPERKQLVANLQRTEAAWADALEANTEAGHRLAAIPLSDPDLIAEKLAILRGDAETADPDAFVWIVDAIASDLARASGRA